MSRNYILCSWTRRLSAIKILTLLKVSYKSSAIPTKLLAGSVCSYRQANPKIHVELQGTPKSGTKPVDSHFPISTFTRKAPGFKMVWCWQTGRHVSRHARTTSPELGPNMHGQLIHNKGVETGHCGKNSLLTQWS